MFFFFSLIPKLFGHYTYRIGYASCTVNGHNYIHYLAVVINGEKVNVSGTGGGLNPRTALGQRADGAVLLLVLDGRQATSLGATLSDVADVMVSFGAVNAGNLDGGGSSVIYYNGEIMNVVMSIYGARGVPDAVCVMPE